MSGSLPKVQVKICGINDAAAYDAACRAGADWVGFVFYPPSPRAVTPEQAGELAARGSTGRRPLCAGLFVDATDAEIGAVLEAAPLSLLQLHGTESPERCAAIRARFGLPVMKALGIATPEDLGLLEAYAPSVDRFLLDAKPPRGATLPGGNAASFDWSLLAGHPIPRPWMLAGGLTPVNVASAIRATGAPAVDVSSGVERMRGVKDPVLIAAFVAAAHAEQD
ncbi:phosphoribosylanthranilate isomerase [Roseomonas sp. E05]|uniref:phosphoribosylanthranilate isomerase n=1 Tax=Roseomonas sp. E05 TaxID=3046310 RepID=UPI0024BB1A18|nr:phosphoribosylanthranilate isomerase [Roseomonas sp. E05]MDJ0389256.1 phosphoribosylanthranilate isomerase [Roseomonas sp. E05]